jgi:multimeric flavodoxin WrbA
MGEHILVINGSPRAEKGTSNIVINRFLEGCSEYGVTSETIHVAKADLEFCAGELACFFKSERKCQIHRKDQGGEFIDKWIKADRIILSSPLHFNSVAAHFVRFLERLLCTVDPFFVVNDGFPTHHGPFDSKPSVIIGVCAYPGIANFDLFREVMLNYQKVFWLEPQGSILVPMARDLTLMTEKNPRYKNIVKVVEAITEAGREWMSLNEIRPDTEDIISMDTDDLEVLFREQSAYFQRLHK